MGSQELFDLVEWHFSTTASDWERGFLLHTVRSVLAQALGAVEVTTGGGVSFLMLLVTGATLLVASVSKIYRKLGQDGRRCYR